MLIQVKLENFRKHEHRTVTFAQGLNVMRAPNEGGKSTLIEAALYALFGATALRDSLADTVTWGKKESELKVELVIEIEGRLFKFSRSKSGAECEYDGGLVTGQKEVSAFASELLGADAASANRLMLANQNNLRGALEEGPKAIATQIESLADFDLFDRLMEAASTKLLSGSPSVFESRVADLESQLAGEVILEPDLSKYNDAIAKTQEESVALKETMERVDPLLRAAEAKLQGAENQRRMRDALESNLTKAKTQHTVHVEQKKDADAKATVRVNLAELDQLRRDQADLAEVSRRRKVYDALEKLNKTYPEIFWEGNVDGFRGEIDRLRASIELHEEELGSIKSKIQSLQGDIRIHEAKLVSSLDCPTCGRPLEDHEGIAHRNNEHMNEIHGFKDQIVGLEARKAAVQKEAVSATEELNDLLTLEKVAAPFVDFSIRYADFITVDSEFYPPKLSWAGAVPAEDTNEQEIKNRISQIEDEQAAAERAASRSESLAQTIQEDVEYIARLEQQLADCPVAGDVGDLKEQVQKLQNELVLAREDLASIDRRVAEIEQEKLRVKFDYESKLRQRAEAEALLNQARTDLDKINFNNALLKKIRGARPLIADKLWGTVLSAVSTMFSQMRGEASVVSKDKDGFKVNGAPVTSLSGSTLDLLGLAIRVSLVRTFLPNTSFLVLDEPGAAMDDDRVTQMLGFIAAAGFGQTILVTHEGISEQFADHLVTL